MKSFAYTTPPDIDAALTAIREPDTAIIAGGTELLNWLKEGIVSPQRLVNITGLPLRGIDSGESGLRIGALARMSQVAADPVLAERYPVLVESLLTAASPQLREMATIGGNLLQRTRCPYFRADTALPCNQRVAGSGCAALDGDTHAGAIFGWTQRCVTTHPSDLAVALTALDADVVLRGPDGDRTLPVRELYRQPGDGAPVTAVEPDELILAVAVPGTARRSHYLKVRERVSYEFALVSVAAVVELDGPAITAARLALGGVAFRPWRLPDAEAALVGVSISDRDGLGAAVSRSFAEARPLRHNGFKVELAQRAAVRALRVAGGAA